MTDTMITGKLILSIAMQPNDAEATTIRDYLIKLLKGVWRDGERFDGKRPFGNSGWETDLYEALARVELITGHHDEDDYWYDFDEDAGNRLINMAIEAL